MADLHLRHWRYISAFHGPWLSSPVSYLEAVAHANYNAPRPRPIDPATLFDLLKIRKLVDEASELAVRAASSIASPKLTTLNGSSPCIWAEMGAPGHGIKLSRERSFRMREQACQKLARAYRLEEIATSVATMQGSSPLLEVGGLVLQRNPDEPDAKYVHFFHEKIPSRQLGGSTDLETLGSLVNHGATECETLRTRATVRGLLQDYDGALEDLTQALSRYRKNETQAHDTPSSTAASHSFSEGRRLPDVILAERDQPTSLEAQLLFMRANASLSLACRNIGPSFPISRPQSPFFGQAGTPSEIPKIGKTSITHLNGANLDTEQSGKILGSQKNVKLYAKRAVKDYLAFLSFHDYSPDLPIIATQEFIDKCHWVLRGERNNRLSGTTQFAPDHCTVYQMSELFCQSPPTNLPPFPSTKIEPEQSVETPQNELKCEYATYHPLLSEALHSFLIAHCVAQTPVIEVRRHALMVARLISLADGFPIFQASRLPARAEWAEILRRTPNWLQLGATWDHLCVPAPLPVLGDLACQHQTCKMVDNVDEEAARLAALEIADRSQTSINGSLSDRASKNDTVTSQTRSDAQHIPAASTSSAGSLPNPQTDKINTYNNQKSAQPKTKSPAAYRRWSPEDGREYPVPNDRAVLVSRWIREAPMVPGTTRRKKRTKKPAMNSSSTCDVSGDAESTSLGSPLAIAEGA